MLASVSGAHFGPMPGAAGFAGGFLASGAALLDGGAGLFLASAARTGRGLSFSRPSGPFSRTTLSCGTMAFMTHVTVVCGLAAGVGGDGDAPRLLVGLRNSRLQVRVYVR